MATRRKRSEHYVNNKEFLAALEVYIAQVNRAKLNDKEPPQIPRYIGECFLKIANHLSYKPNFVNYMFKDDMICDGIENCVRYIHNFNPEKSKNPFAYFTQIIYYAFLRRISQEKKQLEIKNKILEKSILMRCLIQMTLTHLTIQTIILLRMLYIQNYVINEDSNNY